jgi:hypothetical protein
VIAGAERVDVAVLFDGDFGVADLVAGHAVDDLDVDVLVTLVGDESHG